MNIHSMNEEGGFSFAQEFQQLCVHKNSVGMTGDTKYFKKINVLVSEAACVPFTQLK